MAGCLSARERDRHHHPRSLPIRVGPVLLQTICHTNCDIKRGAQSEVAPDGILYPKKGGCGGSVGIGRLPTGEFEGLIEDWRRGRKRGMWRDTFDANRQKYQQFVATVASHFLPQVRDFITAEHSTRKAAIKAWKLLVAELEDDLRMLDAFDPTGKTSFFAAVLMAEGILKDKAAEKAFESGKRTPTDSFGNPEFLSGMVACLDTVIDQTYQALRGMKGLELRLSLARRASQRLHTALIKGAVNTLMEAKSLLLPQLTVVEMELEKFHIT